MARLDAKLGPLVGTRTANALAKAFDLTTVGDLLAYYPRRIADKGELTDLAHLTVGEHVTVLARVSQSETKQYRPKTGSRRIAHRTSVTVTDGNRQLPMTFFRQQWLDKKLAPGTVAWFSGKVELFNGRMQLAHPAWELVDGSSLELEDLPDAGFGLGEVPRWEPIYPASAAVTSKTIGRAAQLVAQAVDPLPDPLPEAVREGQRLMPYDKAVRLIHLAKDKQEWNAARRRLKYDEALVLQTVLALRRAALDILAATPRVAREGGLLSRFDAMLPFTLTGGQLETGAEIAADLEKTHPMHRLLQGEVGSGKTVVALRAMLQVVDAGGQAALLAPTEVLAVQHVRSIEAMLGTLANGGMLGGDADATRVALLTGSITGAARRGAMGDIESGAAGIVIGTHALLEEAVEFRDLGLVVVDEQHRFGVEQRAALTSKGGFTPPHVLVMTATPIPRTVAMTVFGDLDVSTLRELPKGRSPIQTSVVPSSEKPEWLARAWQRVREEVGKGRQVYVVCPRIGVASETPDVPEVDLDDDDEVRRPPIAITTVAPQLEQGALSGLRLEVLHGRLASDEKDAVMRRFSAGEIDVLISTTVIEVGVDVANASVMVVLDADRFGLSQLHQLRGRVGRGEAEGLCLLVTDVPEASKARERLDKIAATSDGFEVARIDLESRREGDVLGATQAGRRSSLRLLSVLRDADVIESAREVAFAIVAADPTMAGHPALADAAAAASDSDQTDYLEKS